MNIRTGEGMSITVEEKKEKEQKIIKKTKIGHIDNPIEEIITLRLGVGLVSVRSNINGKKSEKIISADDFICGLNDKINIDLGLFPRGLISYFRQGPIEITAFQSVPDIKKVNVRGIEEELMIPMPGCIFVFATQQADDAMKLISSSVGILEGPVITERDPIRPFPYGNVYQSGKICWGSIKHKVTKLGDLRIVLQKFFTSTYNGDLFSGAPQKDIITKLKEQAENPPDVEETNIGFVSFMKAVDSITRQIAKEGNEAEFPVQTMPNWSTVGELIKKHKKENYASNRSEEGDLNNEPVFS